MRVDLDHVLVAVPDLETAASRLLEEHGLAAVAGGRHPGLGTANRIVPLGSAYIELIAVVDEAEAALAQRGRRVAASVRDGRTFAGWAARTNDLAGLGRRLTAAGWGMGEIADGARQRPDGRVLRWRWADLYISPREQEPGVLPFLIEWAVPPASHPGAMAVQHPAGPTELVGLRFEDPRPRQAESRLAALLGGGLEFSVAAGSASELTAVELRSAAAGSLLIR